MTQGFLLVDKPRGPTSHDVVAAVRRVLGIRKVGHAGTLDPMATGLVVVAVGRVTRLIRFIQDLPKEYAAIARFGVATTTLDADGEVVHEEPVELTRESVVAAAGDFIGTIEQVPPMVSALKVDGRRLYEIAREGGEVERAARPVEVHSLDVEEVGQGPFPEVSFRVRCGKGTYVRVLADDLAAAVGTRAHLTELRRTRIGSLSVDDAIRMDELGEGAGERLLEPAQALRDLPGLTADDTVLASVQHGRELPPGVPGLPEPGGHVRIVDGDGRLLAVYRATEDRAVAEVVLA